MAGVERLRDIWRRKFHNNSLLALGGVLGVFEPKAGVLAKRFVRREDGGNEKLG